MLAQPPRLTDRRTTAGLDADVRFALVMCDSPAEAFTRLEAKKQTRMQLSLAAERAALASLKAELISMGGDLPPITTAPTATTRPAPAVPERPRTTAQEMDVKDFYKIKSESPHSRVRVPTVLHEDFRAKHFEARIKQQAECYTEVIVPYLRYILIILGRSRPSFLSAPTLAHLATMPFSPFLCASIAAQDERTAAAAARDIERQAGEERRATEVPLPGANE